MSWGAIGGAVIGAVGTMYASNKSADSAGASDKDYRNTQFTDEQSTQLSQMLSSMDKDVAEEIFGTETLQQLQQSVSEQNQQQSTTGSQQQDQTTTGSQQQNQVTTGAEQQQQSSTGTQSTLESLLSSMQEQQQQEQNQQTSTDQTTTGQTDSSSQQQQETTTTTQLGDAQTRQRLADVMNTLGGGSSADEAMDVAMQQILRSGAPAIANVGTRSGTFGSTAEAQLQNDLITKAAEAGTLARVDQQNTEMNQLLQAIQAGQQGTATETGTGVTTGQESTQSQEQMQQMQDMLSTLFGTTDTTTQQDSTNQTQNQQESTSNTQNQQDSLTDIVNQQQSSTNTQTQQDSTSNTQTSEQTATDSTSTSEQQRNASEQVTQEQQQQQQSSSQNASDQYYNTDLGNRPQSGNAPGIARGIPPNALLDDGSSSGGIPQEGTGEPWSISDPRSGGGGMLNNMMLPAYKQATMASSPAGATQPVNLQNLMMPPQQGSMSDGIPMTSGGRPQVGNNPPPAINPELQALLDMM